MIIGVPQEIKIREGRIALVPEAVNSLTSIGHIVYVQSGAGIKSGFTDEEYIANGATILPTIEEIYEHSTMIVKVKEPIEKELDLLKANHILFSYLHLASGFELTERLQKIGLTAMAFETVTDNLGRLPLLAPMSDVAGRLAVQIGSNLLFHFNGGRGILLGGLPAAERGNVVIIGGGVAGMNSAKMAAGMGANVTVFDINRDRLEQARNIGDNVTALHSYKYSIAPKIKDADLVIGAVLIPGDKAPWVVTEEMVKTMKSGSVIVDISIDQGGCIETSQPTTYENPTYVKHGVTHFCVTNMLGAVPRASSQALSAAITPYVHDIAMGKIPTGSVNVKNGQVVHPMVKRLFNK